jgi:hypothetical protein
MDLTALHPQPDPKTTPRSAEWCESDQEGPLTNCCPVPQVVFSIICAAVVIGTKNIRLTGDIRRQDILNRTKVHKILGRLNALLIKSAALIPRIF